MRAFILCLVLAALPVLAEQPPASQQLKEKYLAILRKQVIEMMTLLAVRNPQFTEEDVKEGTESLMKEVEAGYAPLLTVPEAEANSLLTTGPDDKANMGAMQRDMELWKKSQRPLPAIYKKMQDDVSAGKIKGGLELDLTRRISEFDLRNLGLL